MRVSVVIPVYNQAQYVGAAIESALNQTVAPNQIIVVDDGSTDDTPAVCAKYGAKIEYVRQPNAGVSAARNRGLERLAADAVVFLDSDDLLAPDWIERAVAAYQEASLSGAKVGFVYSDYLIFDESGQYEQKVSVKSVHLSGLLRDSLLIPSGMLVIKSCLDDVGLFNGEVNTCEDWDYWLRAVLKGYHFRRVEVIGFKHREHGESASKRVLSALYARVKFLKYWMEQGPISEAQREVMKQELVRTYIRLRRAAYFEGQPSNSYLSEAVALDPDAVMSPWLFVYGSVYISPFFRAGLGAHQVKQAVADMHRDMLRDLQRKALLTPRISRRLRASAEIAMAADSVLAGHYLAATPYLLKALASDLSLVADMALRPSTYAAEITRAGNA